MKKAIQIRYDANFQANCKFASAAGFRYMAINFSHGASMDWTDVEKILCNAGEILEESGLKCLQSHLPCYGLSESSEIVHEDMEDCIHKAIYVSARLGAEWCAYHTRDSFFTGFVKMITHNDNNKLISKFLETAEKNNTGIAIENLPLFNDVAYFTSGIDELVGLVDSFRSDSVGICWDTGHANLLPYDQSDAVRYMGKRLKCTHIHDNYKDDDWHHLPTFGNVDWKSFVSSLRKVGYDGGLTLEALETISDGKSYPDSLVSAYFDLAYSTLRYIDEKE